MRKANYKSHTATIGYDEGSCRFVGSVIIGKTTKQFTGQTLEEAIQGFHKTVNRAVGKLKKG